MSGKQMEGDNQRRRSLARQARKRGQRPSETGATLGSGKQPEHLGSGRRGERPPDLIRNRPATEPATPARTWPLPDSPPGRQPTGESVRYRDLVTSIGRRLGTDFDQARVAAEATVVALVAVLDQPSRERLIDAVPTELHDGGPAANVRPHRDLPRFLTEVARLSSRTREQARYQAQATLNALAEQDRNLIDSLDIPAELRELLEPAEIGGGLVDPGGGIAPLTDDELRAALASLPYWSGDRNALSRTIDLPPDDLDRVLGRIARLRPETGRAPSIGRQPNGSAVVLIRTARRNAVTGLDVALAHQVDAVIDGGGAGDRG
ncbi:DUF2267 domain-containing protein [Solwaraspora sp. WMMD1047]|uniref:DUF2267 domain-containing protein n=1 Tax=Solwaraspora sp. WMMD1047 TaxID=3016102 RepID=UPI002417CCD2|nr:DUF2267 domain-containing protein [Solwaraspora sp. WMMD1047]MDG4829957.1 DUF2267 domain-containing protein [Solwaraspora sp. WMMD1047]